LKDMTTGEIKDLTGTSKKDIEEGILRGHPKVSLDTMFTNDPLRMIRLVRFQAKYGWKIPLSVIKAVKRNAHRIDIISSERIHDELIKVMKYGKLKQAIRLMDTTGLLHYIFPEVEALKGVTQSEKFHSEGDVYKHTLKVLENAKPGVENQIAALLHDIGKPSTRSILPDEIHFYGHEDVGSEIARAIMHRLKFDGAVIDKVVKIVKNHMKPHHLIDAKEPALRRFIREIGDELSETILDLARADELGSLPNENLIPDLIKKIQAIKTAPIKVEKKSVLNGNEIMELGIKQGPEIKKVMEYLLGIQDEYSSENKTLSKEEAKKLVIEKFKK